MECELHLLRPVTRRRTTSALIRRRTVRDTSPTGHAFLDEMTTQEADAFDSATTNVVIRLVPRPNETEATLRFRKTPPSEADLWEERPTNRLR